MRFFIFSHLVLAMAVLNWPVLAQSSEKVIKVGVYDNAPLIYFSDNNKAEGLFVDLLQEISTKQGWDIRFISGNFNELLNKLESKQIDILPVVAYSTARAKIYDFNQQNVLTNWAQIYKLKGTDITSLPDLSTKKVAVLKKDIHYGVYKNLMHQFGLVSDVVEVDSYEQVLQQVSNGSVDAGITNRFFGNQYAQLYQVEKSGIVFNPIKIHFAFTKSENNEILQQIDQQLILLKQDPSSTYYKTIDKWLGENVSVQSDLSRVLVIFLLLSVVLFLVYLLFKLAPVRRAMGLTAHINDRVIANVLLLSLSIALASWAVLTAMDYLWFNPAAYDLTRFVLPLEDQNRLFYRVILVAAILSGGFIVSRLLLRLIGEQNLLHQSETRYKNLFETSDVPIWDEDLSEVYGLLDRLRIEGVTDLLRYLQKNPEFMVGLAGKVKVNHVNAASLRLFNAAEEVEFLHQIDKSFGAGTMEVFIDTLSAYWQGKPFFRAEANFLTLDGKEINTIISYRIPATAEESKHVAVTIVDITDRKQAENDLKISESRFRELFESTDAISVQGYDANRKVIYWNPASESLYGYSSDEAMGQLLEDLIIPPEMRNFVKTSVSEWVNGGVPVPSSELILRKADGSPVSVFSNHVLLKNHLNEAEMFCVDIDLTEIKQIEKALLDNQQLLKEAQSMAHVGNWELDIKTMKATWSDEVFAIFDMEIIDDVGPACLEKMLHPDDREAVLASLQEAMNDGSHHHMEYRIIRPDGTIRWIECQAVQKYNDQGEIIKLRGVIQDITDRKQDEQRLISLKEASERSESKFKAITDQAIEGITVADLDGHYTFVNKAFCDMLGYSESELLQMTVFDVKASKQDTRAFERVKGGDESLTVQLNLQKKDGTVFISEVIGKKIEFAGDTQVLGTIRDITQEVQAQEQILTLSQAVEQSPVSVVITDSQANIEYVNKAFEKITGYKSREVIGLNPRILKSDQTPASLYKDLWQAISQGKPWKGELQNCKKNGELFWEYAHFAPVVDEYGTTRHYLAVKEDITLRKQQEDHILHQAHYDTLTNLPNRFLSLDRLSQLIEEAKRDEKQIAVLFLDMDDFKKVNDTLGHETGDKLLIEAAERLKSAIRTGDTVGRFGGDEFIVLLGGLADTADAQPVADNLLNRFRDSFCIDSRELMITLSIGIAVYPGDGHTTSQLLRNADSAMYHSKQLGRNTYSYFTDEMNRNAAHRLALEEQMHGALGRGEFSVVYQPKIEVASGKIMGAEALLRWTNPALGNISPNEFIPVAEQTGLIVNIGQFVLTEALTKAASWQKDFDSDFNIAVNLSPRQFRDPNLVDFIEQSLRQSGVSSQTLELEITEGVLMSGHGHIDSALAALNNLGVSFAMDDFGTGYSSLSYLRRYPFDVLKIDQSFIRDITEDSADRELISAAIAMAHGLNLKVVAEGVEIEQQLKYLKQLGCDYAQGYLFSKPVSAQDMADKLE